jgi:hypothetical protein
LPIIGTDKSTKHEAAQPTLVVVIYHNLSIQYF